MNVQSSPAKVTFVLSALSWPGRTGEDANANVDHAVVQEPAVTTGVESLVVEPESPSTVVVVRMNDERLRPVASYRRVSYRTKDLVYVVDAVSDTPPARTVSVEVKVWGLPSDTAGRDQVHPEGVVLAVDQEDGPDLRLAWARKK